MFKKIFKLFKKGNHINYEAEEDIETDDPDKITEKVLESINKSEEDLFYSLGVGYIYKDAPKGVSFSANYRACGISYWYEIQKVVYKLCCDDSTKRPKSWLNELLSGDARNLALGMVTMVKTELGVPLSIAIPAAALMLKPGINKFCDCGVNTEEIGARYRGY